MLAAALLDHRGRPGDIHDERNISLREIADTIRQVSAPAAVRQVTGWDRAS